MKDFLICCAMGFGAVLAFIGLGWIGVLIIEMPTHPLQIFYIFLFMGTIVTLVLYMIVWGAKNR